MFKSFLLFPHLTCVKINFRFTFYFLTSKSAHFTRIKAQYQGTVAFNNNTATNINGKMHKKCIPATLATESQTHIAMHSRKLN